MFTKTKTILLLLISPCLASANLEFATGTVALWDFSTQEAVLIEPPQSLHRLSEGVIRQSQTLKLDKECMPQNDDVMNGRAFIVAEDLMVSNQAICEITSNSITKIISPKAPENAYALIYVNSDAQNSYFLVLGRPWTSEGYLKLWTVNRAQKTLQQKDLFVSVPDYSGGVWSDNQHIYVTLSNAEFPFVENSLYRIAIDKVSALLQSSKTYSFTEQFELLGTFPGFTFHLAGVQNDSAFFFNKDYESQVLQISRQQTQVIDLKANCHWVGPQANGWYQLCDEGAKTIFQSLPVNL